jgi:predicted AlkP superfamily pyrophosphatase or phosphodiesterase
VAQQATPGLLEKALGSGWEKKPGEDERRVQVSEYIIKSYRPNLMLIHLIELDSAHHRHGPRTPTALAAAERQDAYIGRIMEATRQAGIFEQTTFLIVSDHGFARIDRKFLPNAVLVKEKLITLDAGGKPSAWKAAAWPAGGSCAIVLRDAKDQATAEKVREIFTKWAEREQSPLKQVLSRHELNQLGAVPEAILMLDAASGYSFGDELTGPEVQDSGKDYRGTHGYLPTRPEMRASLIIYGAGVNPGAKLPLARMIDIAPTAATLLNLNFPRTEGKVIREMLKPAAN